MIFVSVYIFRASTPVMGKSEVPSPSLEHSNSGDCSPHDVKSPGLSNGLPPLPQLIAFHGSPGLTVSSPPPTDEYSAGLNLSTSSRQLNTTALSSRNTQVSSNRNMSGCATGPYRQGLGSNSGSSQLSAGSPGDGVGGGLASSWLTALSGQAHGQKRPPPAHSNTSQPPNKRQILEKISSDSPSSSNSNMSPLVGRYHF